MASYRQVLATPGARRFVPAAFVGRLPISMIGLGTVLLVHGRTGSYGLAGTVSATGALAQALVGPRLGRLVDRHGQARVLLWCLLAHATGMGALLGAVAAGPPAPAWFAAAALGGAGLPPLSSCVRARWSALLGATPALPTALALESVLDEVVFIVGPVLVTTLAVAVMPTLGLGASLGFAVVGTLTFVAARSTDPGPRTVPETGEGSMLRRRGVPVVAGVFLAAGAAFSALEVSMVAFARDRGAEGAAGPLLALVAGGSMVAGLVYGSRRPVRLPHERFLAAAGCFALAIWPLVPAGPVAVMAPAALLAGTAISPMLISGFALVEALVPARARTEGFAWVSTAIGVGIALGAPAAGALVDAAQPRAGFGLVEACGLVAAAVAWAGRRTLALDGPGPVGGSGPLPVRVGERRLPRPEGPGRRRHAAPRRHGRGPGAARRQL